MAEPANEPANEPITELFTAARNGDADAAARVVPIVYEELRKLAHRQMARERPGLTLEPTALVHEAYLRLFGSEDVEWQSRAHFLGAAAQAMRRILVERARRYSRHKHGGGRKRVPLEDVQLAPEEHAESFLALDEALERLGEMDRRKSEIVHLRYFAGLTVEETARVLDVSAATVKNEWRFSKTWLAAELEK